VSRLCLTCSLLVIVGVSSVRADDDTPAAAKTRKLLKKKISVDFKDTRLEDAIDEIKDQVKGLKARLDTKGGVSRNRTLTYKAKDQTVEEVLDGMFKKTGLGYVVISKKKDPYDGSLWIKMGNERGTEKKDK